MMQSRAIDEQAIHIVRTGDVPRAVSVQVTAFGADPVMRWLWPEPRDYLRHFPDLVHGFGGGAFEHETAYVTESFLGGALWLPPGVTPDEAALERLITDTLPEQKRSGCFSMIEQMSAAHPEEAHWHLAFIGVDPACQGRGIGAALLRHTLARIDEQRLHAYLESSNPANIPLYRRHGFEVVRDIRVDGAPPVFPMIRPPR